jgi:hypothetical protein
METVLPLLFDDLPHNVRYTVYPFVDHILWECFPLSFPLTFALLYASADVEVLSDVPADPWPSMLRCV